MDSSLRSTFGLRPASLCLGTICFAMSLAIACGDSGDDANDTSTGTDPSTGVESSTGAASTAIADGSSSGVATVADGSSSGGASSSGGDACGDVIPAVVTDIDETLTTSDEEFLMQVQDASYDPMEREGASELIGAYADLGYRIMYLTARAESIDIVDSDETPRSLTEQWLTAHGYPMDPDKTLIVLSDTFVVGDAAQAYKAQALMDQQALGWRFDYAYGNATSDIGAYAEAGIALDETFIIGEHAGEDGTQAVEGEGWVEHTATQIPTVPAVCEAA